MTSPRAETHRAFLPRLVCTCTRVGRKDGAVIRVKSRSWDCPSCSRDKREKIMLMSLVARPVRMWTLTIADYRSVPSWHDGDAHLHWYTHADGSQRFAVQTWCRSCCAGLSAELHRFRKRIRRIPGLEAFQCLTTVEQTKGVDTMTGEIVDARKRYHRHLAVAGIPQWLTNSQLSQVAAAWEYGALDYGHVKANGQRSRSQRFRDMGAYMSKYMTKEYAQTKVAHGYRRWSRTAGFAPEIRMRDDFTVPAVEVEAVPLALLGTVAEVLSVSRGPPPRPVEFDGWWDPWLSKPRLTRPSAYPPADALGTRQLCIA